MAVRPVVRHFVCRQLPFRLWRSCAVVVVVGLIVVTATACEEVNHIALTFGPPGELPLGFMCTDDEGQYLAARAEGDDEVFESSVVVDFIGLDGMPGCRSSELLRWCQSTGRSCTPMTSHRACIPLPPTAMDGRPLLTVMEEVFGNLQDRVVTRDAPHEPTLVRVVWTAQPCEGPGAVSAEPELAEDQLLGCVLSCPVQLGGMDGEVLLDLPTITTEQCAPEVVACAAPEYGAVAE
ncbi:MAG: hypothetical protein V2A73_22080 [Pseudomonadota bacterium]